MSEDSKPKTPKKLPILGGLMIGIPVVIVLIMGSMLVNADMKYATQVDQDHQQILRLNNDTAVLAKMAIQHNNSITSIVSFLRTEQIPLDIGLLNNDTKLNNTLHHR